MPSAQVEQAPSSVTLSLTPTLSLALALALTPRPHPSPLTPPPSPLTPHPSPSARTLTLTPPFTPHPEQKWSKGKVKEKLQNLVLFDKISYEVTARS